MPLTNGVFAAHAPMGVLAASVQSRPLQAAVILKIPCALPWSKRRSSRFLPSEP